MASFRKAFSSSSMVTMMLKISASESCRSRSARESESFTSCGSCQWWLGELAVGHDGGTSSRLMVAESVELGT
jgi:hypothetical protein